MRRFNFLRWLVCACAVVGALWLGATTWSQTEQPSEPSSAAEEPSPAQPKAGKPAETAPQPTPTTPETPSKPREEKKTPPTGETKERSRPKAPEREQPPVAHPPTPVIPSRPPATVSPAPAVVPPKRPLPAGESVSEPSTVSSERPTTWTDAYWKVRTSLETRFYGADYWGLFLECISVLRGNRLMREYLDNEAYLRWTIASVVLLLVGQAALFAYMGTPIRRMAVLLPRRPLGPVLLGIVGVGLAVPVSVGLVYSFIGIPVAMALWAFLYAAAITGKMGLFLSIGWGISRAFGGKGSSVMPFFVVYLVYLALVILDPFGTGRVFFVAANLVGVGLALRTRFGFGVRPPEPSLSAKIPSAEGVTERTRR